MCCLNLMYVFIVLVMFGYSRGSVMDSVFTLQSRLHWLVHMPVMLVTNVYPGVIKANRA